MPQPEQATVRPPPWWRHGHLWLVIAGPVVVVIASVATAVIAARGADKVVEDDPWRRAVQVDKQPVAERARLPALQARNHAATPTAPER
jgi:hypothetical protein